MFALETGETLSPGVTSHSSPAAAGRHTLNTKRGIGHFAGELVHRAPSGKGSIVRHGC